MILLHGSLPLELIYALIGCILTALALFIGLIIYGVRSRSNKNQVDKLNLSQKITFYIIIIAGAAFIAFAFLLFSMFLFLWILAGD